MAIQKRFRTRRFDFEVNIVPIVDCLTILIIFMLASGVYVSLGMLDVKVSEMKTGPVASDKESPVTLVLTMAPDRSMVLEASGKSFKKVIIRARAENWNFPELKSELAMFRRLHPSLETVSVEPEGEVAYQDVVQAMEVSRQTHPDVLLGGF